MTQGETKIIELASFRRQKSGRSRSEQTQTPKSDLIVPPTGGTISLSELGEHLIELGFRVINEEETSVQRDTSERVSPENLYKDRDTPTQKARLLRVREVLLEGMEYLEKSLAHGVNEIEQEALIPVLYGCVQQARSLNSDMLFGEVLTALEVAVASRRAQGYNRRHLLSLRDVIRILIDSPITSEARFNKAIDILEGAAFDLGFPIKDVSVESL